MKKPTQRDQVVDAIKRFGAATLSQLNNTVGNNWGTKTPEASIRRIVQTDARVHKIKPGLYCLKGTEAEYDNSSRNRSTKNFYHTLYQVLLLAIGKHRGFDTYVSYHDKNKSASDTGIKLSNMSTLDKLPEFWPKSDPLKVMQKARTVDVVWMHKKRKMPRAFFEVETTTDMKTSFGKFFILQDYRADMVIIAPQRREQEYKNKIGEIIYSDIESNVRFKSAEELEKEAEELLNLETVISDLWRLKQKHNL